MHRNDIIIFSVVMVFLAFRLYQKYIKKKDQTTRATPDRAKGTAFPSSAKDDEYEPYSKK